MSGKETVQVIVRTRPTSNFAEGVLNIEAAKHEITVHLPKDTQIANNKLENWSFKMSRVLHNATQDVVYDNCCRDIVDSVLSGFNGTVLAYGQTGAGKTYTMAGGADYPQRGIIPRAIGHVFSRVSSAAETTTTVRLSYLEIYNESFFDLLNPDGPELAVRDEPGTNGQVNVKGLKKVVVDSEEAALNCFFEGQEERSVAAHNLNNNSTRSHCILTIYLETRSNIESSEKVIISKLNLVDLAGSERVGKTHSTGMLLREAKSINKSLTFLEQVIVALASRSRDHVPFRQSKLTNVLRDSLGGNCKTRMVANIWAEKDQMEETISTLKFGVRMMKLTNEATINVKLDPEMLIKKYQKEIRELRQELAMHDTLANRGGVNYDSYTPEQQAACRGEVNAYIKGDKEIGIVSLRQIKEVFFQFKSIVLEERLNGGGGGGRTAMSAESMEDTLKATSSSHQGGTDGLVGDVDQDAGGFHLGHAPDQSRPVGGVEAAKVTNGQAESEAATDTKAAAITGASVHKAAPKKVLSETEAFEEYKKGDGVELQDQYQQTKGELNEKKRTLKSRSKKINEYKKEIDTLEKKKTAKSKERQNISNGDVDVIDEEEYAIIQQLGKKKKQYDDEFQKRRDLMAEVNILKADLEKQKMKLCNEFLEWYNLTYAPQDDKDVEDEVLDDGEQFDRLERDRVMDKDPDSISYYNAQKNQKRAGKRR